jgi:hypothetical protein
MRYNDMNKNLPARQNPNNYKMFETVDYGWLMLEVTPITFKGMEDLITQVTKRTVADYPNASARFRTAINNKLVHYYDVKKSNHMGI